MVEPAPELMTERGLPELAYFDAALRLFPDHRFLVFSDDVPRARVFLAPLHSSGVRLRFIEENVVVSLALMARCRHHILTSSTLSFWGAYLDKQQPTGGRTILPSCFFMSHPRAMIPYRSWEVVETTCR
jgi:hypothetical protein